MTQPVREKASASISNFIWLRNNASSTLIRRLTQGDVAQAINRFVERHSLYADQPAADGTQQPLRLNIGRFRQTFAQSMWSYSAGNLLRTSKLLGNLPRITDRHYLAVTPEMKRNHKFVGLILHATVTEQTGNQAFRQELADQLNMNTGQIDKLLGGEMNTGVGRCSDYISGKFAPKNGKDVCTRFLHYFRCPNQVVMESDLHRLFSFYWLLLKERNIVSRSRWKQNYSWIIREIDNRITPKFNHDIVQAARERARISPHPMWRDRVALGATIE